MRKLTELLFKVIGTILFADEFVPMHKKIKVRIKPIVQLFAGIAIMLAGVLLLGRVNDNVVGVIVVLGGLTVVFSDRDATLH